LGRGGGARKRDGEATANPVGRKMEKCGVMETKSEKCFREQLSTAAKK
jgi:hypothetical protein